MPALQFAPILIYFSFFILIIIITALPTQSPARHCMKFERRRSNGNVGANKQLNSLDDNSISSNEYQEEDDDDDNNDIHDNYVDQQNNTQDVS